MVAFWKAGGRVDFAKLIGPEPEPVRTIIGVLALPSLMERVCNSADIVETVPVEESDRALSTRMGMSAESRAFVTLTSSSPKEVVSPSTSVLLISESIAGTLNCRSHGEELDPCDIG